MRAALLVTVVGLVGCAGELEQPERFADCAPGYVEQIFSTRCGDCHGSDEPMAGLDLVSAGVSDRLVGVQSASACDGRTLIDPMSTNHLLLTKLDGSFDCGAAMPLGPTKLSYTDVECVRRWIDEVVAVSP